MKTLGYFTCAMLICSSIASCDKKGTEPIKNAIYFNSFESAEDTSGWHGITEAMFVSDPAPEGGSQSLHIGGGCIQPAAHINLPEGTRNGYYQVSCWGKLEDLAQGGSIGLVVDAGTEQRRETHLSVSDTVWTFYQSEETLYCPLNHSLRLEIVIGGFVPAGMFVDCIQVERVW